MTTAKNVEAWRKAWTTEVNSLQWGMFNTVNDDDMKIIRASLKAVQDIIDRTVF